MIKLYPNVMPSEMEKFFDNAKKNNIVREGDDNFGTLSGWGCKLEYTYTPVANTLELELKDRPIFIGPKEVFHIIEAHMP